MALSDVDLTAGSDFELIELQARVKREQERRNAMSAANAQIKQAVLAYLTVGGTRDGLVAEIQNAGTAPDPEPDPDPAPGPDTDAGQGDAGETGGDADPGSGETDPSGDEAGETPAA